MTVGDDSVSRVISLRLDEAQALAERRPGRPRLGGLGSAHALLATQPRRDRPTPERRRDRSTRRRSTPDWEPDPADFDDPRPTATPVEPRPSPSPSRCRSSRSPSRPARRIEPPAPSPSRVEPPPSPRPGRRAVRPDAVLAVDHRGRPRRRPRADPRRLHVPAARLPRDRRPRARPGTRSRRRSSPATSGPPWRSTSSSAPASAATRAAPEAAVRAELAALLVPRDLDWSPRSAVAGGPAVVLVVGVNGTGKTTTIGKLASRYAAEGRSVILAAADTFRAAAIDQLRIWADRAKVADDRPRARAPTRAPSSTTRSTPPSPAAPTSSSPTPPAASTRSRT